MERGKGKNPTLNGGEKKEGKGGRRQSSPCVTDGKKKVGRRRGKEEASDAFYVFPK